LDTQQKERKDKPLSPAQQGWKWLRTISLARANVVIGLKVASHNLMRLARLQHRGIAAV